MSKAAQPRRSKEQITALLKLHERSTGTTKDFCRQHNISEGAFYAARKRYHGSKVAGQQVPGFTALSQPAGSAVSTGLFAEVGQIKIYQAVPPDYLKALLS